MPNCKSFLVPEAERKHVRRYASLVAVGCFLPGWAKDLSAPLYIIMVITSSWNIYIITEWNKHWTCFHQFFISYTIICFYYKQHFLCTAWKMSGRYSSLFDASHFVLNVIFTVCPTNQICTSKMTDQICRVQIFDSLILSFFGTKLTACYRLTDRQKTVTSYSVCVCVCVCVYTHVHSFK